MFICVFGLVESACMFMYVIWSCEECMHVYVCVCVFGLVDIKKPYFIEEIRKAIISKSRRKKQGKDHMSFRNMYVIS